MNVRMCVIVQGHVQGVAFRHHTCRQARELGVTGWVRNLADGSVEGLFEGDEAAVQTMVEWCRNGPPTARVTRVDTSTGTYNGEYDTFAITC